MILEVDKEILIGLLHSSNQLAHLPHKTQDSHLADRVSRTECRSLHHHLEGKKLVYIEKVLTI